MIESSPMNANLSEFIIEGMLMGDVSTSSVTKALGTPSLPLLASVRSMKHKRGVSESSLLQVPTDDASNAKRRKANPSANDKEIDDGTAWTLDRVRMKTASYVKSVWSAALKDEVCETIGIGRNPLTNGQSASITVIRTTWKISLAL
ncbi:hypothetical protein FRB94_011930 [Tulasnella sp. JGI-2019a]|nr:hypothetical protein FRB93_010236 [Tulasnella sp. JGI-2019a]KAG8992157.1 hypothetical protein FRB94_011930 [Tulasnella sp. JGI-2019a]